MPTVRPTPVPRKTPTLAAAAATIQAAFQDSDVVSVSFDGTEPSADRANTYLHIAVKDSVSATSPAYIEETWEADIASGAVAELLNNHASPALCNAFRGTIVTWRNPEGKVAVQSRLTFTPGFANEDFSAASQTSAQTMRSVTDEATALGFHVNSVRVINADGPAVALIVTIPSVKSLTADLVRKLTLLVNPGGRNMPARFVGSYEEIRDSTGHPLFKSGGSARAASGTVWEAPGYQLFAHGRTDHADESQRIEPAPIQVPVSASTADHSR